ncbi:MAG: BspA family leucine-rich repeat surface protein [Defluviitaleaceae bacterium]|nr:BspA family leucine-rich repeat surface protein [Defluviitaleaceae bacterium]
MLAKLKQIALKRRQLWRIMLPLLGLLTLIFIALIHLITISIYHNQSNLNRLATGRLEVNFDVFYLENDAFFENPISQNLNFLMSLTDFIEVEPRFLAHFSEAVDAYYSYTSEKCLVIRYRGFSGGESNPVVFESCDPLSEGRGRSTGRDMHLPHLTHNEAVPTYRIVPDHHVDMYLDFVTAYELRTGGSRNLAHFVAEVSINFRYTVTIPEWDVTESISRQYHFPLLTDVYSFIPSGDATFEQTVELQGSPPQPALASVILFVMAFAVSSFFLFVGMKQLNQEPNACRRTFINLSKKYANEIVASKVSLRTLVTTESLPYTCIKLDDFKTLLNLAINTNRQINSYHDETHGEFVVVLQPFIYYYELLFTEEATEREEEMIEDVMNENVLTKLAWELGEDGRLSLSKGVIPWEDDPNRWENCRHQITDIVFTEQLTMGTSLASLFSDLPQLMTIEGLAHVDTSAVTNMSHLFNGATGLTALDLSKWQTQNVTDMSLMFANAKQLTHLDLSGWDTRQVMDMSFMFYASDRLRVLTLGKYFKFIDSYAWECGGWHHASLPEISKTDEFTGYWQNVGEGSIENPMGEHVFTSSQFMDCFDGQVMADTFVWQPVKANSRFLSSNHRVAAQGQFENGADLAGAQWELDEAGTLRIGDGWMNWTGNESPWHAVCEHVQTIIFTGAVTAGPSLTHLFSALKHVTHITGLTYVDTRQVQDMRGLFRGTSSLESLDLLSWDTSHVTDMSQLFMESGPLLLDLSSWDTSQVTTMQAMFWGADRLALLDVSTWDTSQVTDMEVMFWGVSRLESLDVSTWHTHNVKQDSGMNMMFTHTTALTELTLGVSFDFQTQAELPHINPTDVVTGYWQNVGSGTIEHPQGKFIFTSAQLMEKFDGKTMADTWVWQPMR